MGNNKSVSVNQSFMHPPFAGVGVVLAEPPPQVPGTSPPQRGGSGVSVPPSHRGVTAPSTPGSANRADVGVALSPSLSPASHTFLSPSEGHRAKEPQGHGGGGAGIGRWKGRGHLQSSIPLR